MKASKSKATVKLVVSSFLLMIFVNSCYELYISVLPFDWPNVDGEVVRSEIREERRYIPNVNRFELTYLLDVEYQCEIGGSVFQKTSINHMGYATTSRSTVAAEVPGTRIVGPLVLTVFGL